MNRLNLLHTGIRTDFPASLTRIKFDQVIRDRTIAPIVSFYLAIAGFMGCGAVIIVAASLVALRIQ